MSKLSAGKMNVKTALLFYKLYAVNFFFFFFYISRSEPLVLETRISLCNCCETPNFVNSYAMGLNVMMSAKE